MDTLIAGEISPLFELTLLELVEYFGIAGFAVAIFTSVILYKQFKHTSKVQSSQLLVDYVERILEKNQHVLNILRYRVKDDTKKFKHDRDVLVLLNGLENIIQFRNDGVLDKKQILNVLKSTLNRIKKDLEVKRIVGDSRTSNKNDKLYALIFDFIDENII